MKNGTILLDTNAYSRLMQGDEFVIRSADEAKRIVLCSVVLGELECVENLLVSYIADTQLHITFGQREGELTKCIGNGTFARNVVEHGGADKGFACFSVGNGSANGSVLSQQRACYQDGKHNQD